jgi:hypothetical protein
MYFVFVLYDTIIFLLSLHSAKQLYHIENLLLPGHFVTGVVLKMVIKLEMLINPSLSASIPH